MMSTSGIWLTTVKIDQIEPNKLLKRLRKDLLRLKLKKSNKLVLKELHILDLKDLERICS